jgi:beta-trans-bergamotene synthase
LLVQIDGLEEDRLAKPNRPLPAGRISVENARALYYVLFMLMWAASLYARTTLCTLVYSIAIVVYNEGGLAKLHVLKNVVGALGLACYCWGTTIILGIKSHFISLWRFPFVFKLTC